ncbi:MAG: hypothetical protein AB7N76_11835 [Planctomycetota bacterium]
MDLPAGLLQFFLVCAAAAFVCTAIKEDEDQRLGASTLRLLGLMGGGILGFALVVQAFTVWAS